MITNKRQQFRNLFLQSINLQLQMSLNRYRKSKPIILQSCLKDRLNNRVSSNILPHNRPVEMLERAKQLYYKQTDIDEAAKLFSNFLKEQPNHDEALYLAGVCQMKLEKLQAAILRFEKISQDYPLKQNALLLTAIAYSKLKFMSKSLETVSYCLKRNPDYQEALCFRGKMHLQMNNLLKARSDFKSLSQLNAESYLAQLGLADCQRLDGNLESAIELYVKGLKIMKLMGSQPTEKLEKEIQQKIGICLFQLQRYEESFQILQRLSSHNPISTSELFYYLGLCEVKLGQRQKGLNHLEFAIRFQTNPFITEKAFRKLLLFYIQDLQFYEALNVIKMAQSYKIKADFWTILIDSFMMIIRGKFKEGLLTITKICNKLQINKPQVIKIDLKHDKITNLFLKNDLQGFRRKLFLSSPDRRQFSIKKHNGIEKKPPMSKPKRSLDKISSMRIKGNTYQSLPLKTIGRFKTEHIDQQDKYTYELTQRQKQVIYPLILQLKAYCELFTNQYSACIQTYEQYESYIENKFGKESDIRYNKTVCEIMLLNQSGQLEQSLLKCNQAINIYYFKNQTEPVEPILYKIAILIKLVISNLLENLDKAHQESDNILVSILEMIKQKQILQNNSLAYYLSGFIYILKDQYSKSKQSFETAIRKSQQCSSGMLYSKGITELKLGNYINAFKDFSASIIMTKTERSYLARSITLFHLSLQKNDIQREILIMVLSSLNLEEDKHSYFRNNLQNMTTKDIRESLIEKSLDDLQNFIEYCDRDQQITIWVTKMLFVTYSFDEALSSLDKVSSWTDDINKIRECLQIYEGEFQSGGIVGLMIKSAFDGQYLTYQSEGNLLKNANIKVFNKKQSDYLTAHYQKWLIILHLYQRQSYTLLLKYISKLIFQGNDQEQEFLLRYNLALIFFIIEQQEKAYAAIQSLKKFKDKYKIHQRIEKIIDVNFVEDQCLQDLSSSLYLRSNKMLSSFLSYKPIYLKKDALKIRVFTKINIPFPKFYQPNLEIQFDINFILYQLDLNKIPKKIDAPWIKKNQRSLQFTEILEQTITSFCSQGGSKGRENSIIQLSYSKTPILTDLQIEKSM